MEELWRGAVHKALATRLPLLLSLLIKHLHKPRTVGDAYLKSQDSEG